MNPRKFIEFFRTPTGNFVGFLLISGLVLSFIHGCRRSTPASVVSNRKSDSFLNETVKKKLQEFNPSPVVEKVASNTPSEAPPAAPVQRELPPISLYAMKEAVTTELELGPEYAPFGRLIRCLLIITVDSSQIATPIIGLVTEDVFHDGRLIIPAGTEVHGRAALHRSRERISSQGTWTLVWRSGLELTVNGIALDHDKAPDANHWDLRDGSAGLRGEVIQADDAAAVKLFLSTALSGVADSLKDRQPTLLGNIPLITGKNAALGGASQVLELYAQQILEAINRDGVYVRVPAGKTFYLYVTQTIDLAHARAGSTRFRSESRLNSPTVEGHASKAPSIITAKPLTAINSNNQ